MLSFFPLDEIWDVIGSVSGGGGGGGGGEFLPALSKRPNYLKRSVVLFP